MFQNVAPLGCLPMIQDSSNITGNGCARQPLTLAALHNRALSKMAESMAQCYTEFIYSIYDFYTALGERISHPKTYGTYIFFELYKTCPHTNRSKTGPHRDQLYMHVFIIT